MGLSIGIIGLPNVGKSTLFNALTKTQNAAVANYPFCTIQPNRAVVPVPDDRVGRLAALAGLYRTIHATVEFVDIAGLVRGASQGEGLGNQFLGNIRDTDAILHVVRCFEDVNVVHIADRIDPHMDIDIVNMELIFADLQQLERKIDRLARQVKGDKKYKPVYELSVALQEHLNAGRPISQFARKESETYESLIKEMRFLTAKPVIYAANVDEDAIAADNPCVATVKEIAISDGVDMVTICGKFEEEISGLSEEDRREFLELAGVEESALDQVIRKCYNTLGLISFFTMNEEEVRAWNIPDGTYAPQAAGVVHTDFERGFIRAEVIPFEVFDHYGSISAVKAAGELQLEGKEYVVQDGDVIYVRFNV